ncbi:MAG: TetR family transcriptional regulator [Acidobacteria bacterium]|nr:TetR family transcriptional regulator [Acidobacteriota bacterium]
MLSGRNRNRMNGKPRQREYDKSSRTRAAILAAALDEFSEHGFGAARIDRIAKAAKLNNHALYYHFGDKAQLFQAVLEHGYASLRADRPPRNLAAMPPEAGMARIVEDVFEFVERVPKHMSITRDVNRHRGVNLTPAIRRHIRAAAKQLVDDIALVQRRGLDAGCFADGIDAEHMYFSIFALCSFYFTNAYTVSAGVGRDLLKPAAVRERKAEIVRFVLSALRR